RVQTVGLNQVYRAPPALQDPGDLAEDRILLFDRNVTDHVRGDYAVEGVALDRYGDQAGLHCQAVVPGAVGERGERGVNAHAARSALSEYRSPTRRAQIKQPAAAWHVSAPEAPFTPGPIRQYAQNSAFQAGRAQVIRNVAADVLLVKRVGVAKTRHSLA